MTTILRAGSATDVGRVRTVNQDSKLITDRLYAVADGMGGHQGGEVASAITVEILHDSVIEPSVDSLLDAAHAANTAVLDKASESADLRGMGTTLCAITLVEGEEGQDDEIGWVSVGDSRIYLFRDAELLQLTTDHSLVEDLRRDGQLSEEEAAVHPQRNILTRALGIDPDVVIDSHTVIPYVGDRFLICSDGLFNEVSESLMAATLRGLADPDDAAAELVRLANEHGGRDNITCVIVDVVDDGGRSQAASEAMAAPGSDGAVGLVSDPTLQQPAVPASSADQDDVAGFATPAPTGHRDDELWGQAVPPKTEDHLAGDLSRGRVKHVTWRVVLFFVVLAVIAGGAIGAIAYLERNKYYVGYHGQQVAVFKGTPSGILWFKPTFEENKRIPQSNVTNDDDKLLRKGVQRSTRAGADQYVEEVRRHFEAKQASTPTTTTTTTTTTTSPGVLSIDPAATTGPPPTTGVLSPPP